MSPGLLRALWQPYLIKMAAGQGFPVQWPPQPQPQQATRQGLNPWVAIPALAGSSVGGILGTQYAARQVPQVLAETNAKLQEYRKNLLPQLIQKRKNWSDAAVANLTRRALAQELKADRELLAEYKRLRYPAGMRTYMRTLRLLGKRPWVGGATTGLISGLAGAGLGKLMQYMVGD